MVRSAEFCGAFCLMRLIPLLDAVGSPIRSAVERIAEALLAGEAVSDDILIHLDDYRQAAGEQIGFERPPVSFEVWIANITILAAGAETRLGRPPVETALADARDLWAELSTMIADASGSRGSRDLDAEEIAWQHADEQAAQAATGDRAVAERHAVRLANMYEANRSLLQRIIEEKGWRATGPCRASQCDWPRCDSGELRCIKRRAFRPKQSLGAALRRKHGQSAERWFVRVMYLDASDEQPFEIISEISAAGYETRKIVGFVNGIRIPVDSGTLNRGISLKVNIFPSISQLQSPNLHVEELSERLFEELWSSARGE